MSASKIPFLIFLLSFMLPKILKSQQPYFPKHSIILDVGGIAAYGSLNYERIIFSKESNFISAKVGFSFYRFMDYERDFNPDLLSPISLQVGRKWKSHAVVFGLGQTVSSIVQASSNFDKKIRKSALSASGIIGYRFQKNDRPFSFQISYSPIFERYENLLHWGGLSFGYSFNQKTNDDEI